MVVVKIVIKTFLFGILLGIAAAAGVLYAKPIVDQHRETSLISVAANGGNVESFHINIPMDRIMVGREAASELPEGLEWPANDLFSDVVVELFKIRNSRDAVIGIASRTAVDAADDNAIDWVLHFPARGSVFLDMDIAADGSGLRSGKLAAGSREFAALNGIVTERWVSDTSGAEDAPDGRIELQASYVGAAEPVE